MAALVPVTSSSDETAQVVTRLEAELQRQIALREVADRMVARARDNHEEAFERLLLRCRFLEDEKVKWTDDSQRTIGDLKREHAEDLTRRLEVERTEWRGILKARDEVIERLGREVNEMREALADRDKRLAAAAEREALADRDRRIAAAAEREALTDRDNRLAAAEEREGSLGLQLAAAEERFRAEAFHLSALVALHSKEAQAAQAEVERLRQQLASVFASTSWSISRPLRVASRLMRRLRRGPSRLVGLVRRRP